MTQKTKVLFVTLTLLAGTIFTFLLPHYYVHFERPVRSNCDFACARFGGDCVEALLELLESGRFDYERQNDAVWTLARFGDERALPVLRRLSTGGDCPRPCRKDEHLCQREIEKAIRFCSSPNLGSFLIRLRIDP